MRALVLLAMLASCKASGTFQCATDQQCGAQGICQQAGWCSFPDSSCMSGYRYDEYAGGGLGGRCVGDEPIIDAAPDPEGIDSFIPPSQACARLALGSDHTCALRGGNVYCWGLNGFGELGGSSPTTPVNLGLPAVHLASSKYHSCAVLMDGTVKCWGYNDAGQLGRGTTGGSSATPATVMGMTGAVQVTTGRSQSCARRADGTIRCWGNNTSGALGDGTMTSQNTAVTDVTGVTGATNVHGTGSHVCATTPTGATCWGSNDHGQLGDGTMTDRPTPIAAPVTNPAWIGTASFSAGIVGAHTCAIIGGAVHCFGDGTVGQLGDGLMTDSTTPVTATGITDAVQVAMGRWHVCARTATKRVLCWGRNPSGEVGDNTNAQKNAPVDVGLTDVEEVAAGGFHTCAITSAKQLYCWGENGSGQLGVSGGDRLVPTLSLNICP